MVIASKIKSSLYAWLLALVVVLGLAENRAWGFFEQPQPAPGPIALATPEATGENYDAFRYDASDYAVAAKSPLALPYRPSFGTSLSDVSKHFFKNGKLPDNFITKAEAKALGWNPKKGNLHEVAPGRSIGGDVFGNNEGLLPSSPGRTWFEADLNYTSGFRGSERLLYSSDGLIFQTADHYKTFTQLGAR